MKMKNKRFWLGILAMVLVFGMTVVGCDNDSKNGNDGGGIFTLTEIPSIYNGWYAALESYGHDNLNIWSPEDEIFTISNGRVSMPVWIDTSTSYKKYTGNDTVKEVWVYVWSASESSDDFVILTFDEVSFSNGSATKSWNDADDIED